MSEHSGRHAGEEDFFDRWLAHRDVEERPGEQPRSSTVPPQWAPKAVAPPSEPVPDQQDPEQQDPELQAGPLPARRPQDQVTTDPPTVVIPAGVATPAPPAATGILPAAPGPRRRGSRDRSTPDHAPRHVESPTGDAPPPIRHTFAPRTRARTAVGVGTLLAATAAVIGCYVAAREKDLPSIGIAATLWVLTGIIWAVHSGTSVTRLSVRGGQLQVTRHGVRTTIDLTSSFTPVEVHGRPGRHGWKVVFLRRDLSAFVIDQSMVDPDEFMRVLRYYRPEVDTGTG